MKKFSSRASAVALALSVAFASPAFTQTPAPTQDANQPRPRFIWGELVKIAASSGVFTALGDWLKKRLTGETGGSVPQSGFAPVPVSSSQACMPAQNPGAAIGTLDALANVAPGGAGAKPQQGVVGATQSRSARSADRPKITEKFVTSRDVVLSVPTKPLQVQGKDPNYEGVHVAIVALESTGNRTSVRAVNDGFRTGEKFKLRVVSTFEGLVAIDNINPKGEQKRLYPDGSNVVAIPLGQEVLLPLAACEWFELAGDIGKEQLVITVRDRRAFGEVAAKNQVFRKDEKYGSNFVQEVEPGKTFPVITQSITFSHTR